MAFFRRLSRGLRALWSAPSSLPPLPGEGEMPRNRDTLTAIHDLSRLVQNDPDAIDIYLALGNLFRAQGDIERAVLIREGLMARPGLNTKFKARALFELGQDYRRAGVVDRSLASYREAARLGYSAEAVTAELANLYAESGDFAQAADEYHRLGHTLAEAHYLVRQAEDTAAAGDDPRAHRLVRKALKVYSGSVEGWCAIISMTAQAEEWRKTSALLSQGLNKTTLHLRFLLLEALHNAGSAIRGSDAPATALTDDFSAKLAEVVIPVLENQPPHILLHYYGALFLKRCNDIEGANIWLSKALVVQPDFWAARLELLAIAAASHELPPAIAHQLTYFTNQMEHIKRFTCAVCGLRQDGVFYRCPRCGSWHSISFRFTLQE